MSNERLEEDIKEKYHGRFVFEAVRVIELEKSLDELVLFEDGSMKFRGKFVSAKEVKDEVIMSFRDEEFGDLLAFGLYEMRLYMEDFEKADKAGRSHETILDLHRQDIFFRELTFHYNAYGEKGLESFFTGGKEAGEGKGNGVETQADSTTEFKESFGGFPAGGYLSLASLCVYEVIEGKHNGKTAEACRKNAKRFHRSDGKKFNLSTLTKYAYTRIGKKSLEEIKRERTEKELGTI